MRASMNKDIQQHKYTSALGISEIRCTTTAVCLSHETSDCARTFPDSSAGDLSEREGYDFEQIKSIAKVEVGRSGLSCEAYSRGCLVQLATVLHVAGFDLAADVDGDD